MEGSVSGYRCPVAELVKLGCRGAGTDPSSDSLERFGRLPLIQ
jgi:hypothetical protein